MVASYAGPLVEGLQGKVGARDFLGASRVVATAKHFLGDGGTFEGRDQGDTRVGESVLRDVHGAGYAPALNAGAQTVMASFSSWNGIKMHGHTGLLTEVLKQRMGFDGFVVGDWNAQGQLPGCTNTDCPAAFNAGVDMMMTPDTWKGYYESTLKHVKSGTIPMARLDDAVTRILRVKLRAGLFEAGLPVETCAQWAGQSAGRCQTSCCRAPRGTRIAGPAEEQRQAAAAESEIQSAGRRRRRRRYRQTVRRLDADLARHRAESGRFPQGAVALGGPARTSGSRGRPRGTCGRWEVFA